jgi:hypothetical protein
MGGVNRMKRAEGVAINYLVGSMMVAFLRELGPIPSKRPNDHDTPVRRAYNEMEKIREQISETLLDYIDADEEEKIMKAGD